MVKSRRMRLVLYVAQVAKKRYACRLLVGKLEAKGPLGRPRQKWI
jgi:hypothetical protein